MKTIVKYATEKYAFGNKPKKAPNKATKKPAKTPTRAGGWRKMKMFGE